ncbi:hypothetical protein NQ317_016248 [Molorchus minor]|uniref:Peptidase A2 domain-containing protein n=1 Tax=Molorchus minor TaxID=1323400 RepID=A0ABQ9JYH1_9CUCU|nr:hypothetical protein NQ317_016248 [Molorchus minor]
MAVLDFILSHADGDERPYLSVSILGTSMSGLLDSGASNTIIGGPGWEVISKLNLPLNKSDKVRCRVANGEVCVGLGSVDVPFQIQDRVKIITTLVVPSVSHSLILGADFWRLMGIVPDLRHGSWTFSSTNVVIDSVALHSQTELDTEQLERLNRLVDRAFADMGDSLGCTTLVEHEIKTSSPPIKQRSSINEERANGFARVYSDVKKRLQHAYENSKSHYNLRRRDEQFLPNDLVWRKNYVQSDASKYFAAKLAPRFVGPYRVAKRLSPWTYELVDNENKFGGVWHAKDLKAHPPDNSDN